MWLNIFAGRSFQSISSYPIFPTIKNGTIIDRNSKPLEPEIVSYYLRSINPFNSLNDEDYHPEEEEFLPETYFSDEINSTPEKVEEIRLSLESDLITKQLPNWIDNVFGFKREDNDTQEMFGVIELPIPEKLFDDPHPEKRNILKDIRPIQNPKKSPLPLLSYVICGSNFINIYGFLNDLTLYDMTNSEIISINFQNPSIVLPNDQKLISFSNNISPSFAFSSPNSLCVYYYDYDKAVLLHSDQSPHLSTITTINSSGKYILSGSRDSSSALWEIANDSICQLSFAIHHSSPVSCSALSMSYRIAVMVSHTYELSISLLPSLDLLSYLKIDFSADMVPAHIIITISMGYIVVAANSPSCSEIKTYTINGKPISSRQFPSRIISLNTYQVSMRDYIHITCKNNLITADPVSLQTITDNFHDNDIVNSTIQKGVLTVTFSNLSSEIEIIQ